MYDGWAKLARAGGGEALLACVPGALPVNQDAIEAPTDGDVLRAVWSPLSAACTLAIDPPAIATAIITLAKQRSRPMREACARALCGPPSNGQLRCIEENSVRQAKSVVPVGPVIPATPVAQTLPAV